MSSLARVMKTAERKHTEKIEEQTVILSAERAERAVWWMIKGEKEKVREEGF